MLRLAPLVILLAACPPPGRGGPIQPQPQIGAGCPAARAIYLASYLTASDKTTGHTGWVLPLSAAKVETIENLPEYAPLDAAAVAAANLTAPASPTAWLIAPNVAPCRATIGRFYVATVDGGTPNLSYGVELDGCPVPADPQNAEAVVLAQELAPADCHVEAPHPVAARLGEVDAKKQWSRPIKATPIPPAFAAIVPPHACTPPTCETLWSIGEVDIANQPVAWAGAVNWLAIPTDATPESQCEWKAETFSGFFVTGPDGKPLKVTEGQDHPLVLTSVLVDRSGAKALLAETAGEYATYDLAAGAATLGHHVAWLVAQPEADVDDHLGPECGE